MYGSTRNTYNTNLLHHALFCDFLGISTLKIRGESVYTFISGVPLFLARECIFSESKVHGRCRDGLVATPWFTGGLWTVQARALMRGQGWEQTSVPQTTFAWIFLQFHQANRYFPLLLFFENWLKFNSTIL